MPTNVALDDESTTREQAGKWIRWALDYASVLARTCAVDAPTSECARM